MEKRYLQSRFVLLAFILVTASIQNAEAKKLPIEVFYSPMDQKSGEFIKNSVAAMSKKMFSLVNLTVYPVAGCAFEEKLICDGGELEANASINHVCSFNALSPEIDGQRDAYEGLQYIACTLNPPKVDLESCEDKIKDVKSKVDKCVNDLASISSIMSRYKRVNPGYKPFVVIDGKQSKTQDQAALKSWMLVVCRTLKEKAPAECDKIGSFKREGEEEAAAEGEGTPAAAAGGDATTAAATKGTTAKAGVGRLVAPGFAGCAMAVLGAMV